MRTRIDCANRLTEAQPFDGLVYLPDRESPLYARKSLSISVTVLQKALCK